MVRKASGGRPAHLILHFITSRHASQPTPATPLEATRTRGDPHRPPDLCIPSPCAESTAATTTFALLVASPPLRCGRAEPTAAAAQPAPQSQARGFWKLPSHLVGWSPTTQIARPRLLRRQPGRCRLCPRYDRRIRALGWVVFGLPHRPHTHTSLGPAVSPRPWSTPPPGHAPPPPIAHGTYASHHAPSRPFPFRLPIQFSPRFPPVALLLLLLLQEFFFFLCVLTNSHDDHCSMRMQAPFRLRKWNELTSPVRFGDSSVRRSPCQDKQRERERERARASGGREGKGRDGTREGTSQRWRAVRFPAVRCSFDGRHLPNGRLPAVPHTATAGLLHAHARLSSAAAPTPPAAPQSSSFLLRFASVPFPSPPLPTSPASSGLAVAAPTAEPALAPAAIRINSSVQIRLD